MLSQGRELWFYIQSEAGKPRRWVYLSHNKRESVRMMAELGKGDDPVEAPTFVSEAVKACEELHGGTWEHQQLKVYADTTATTRRSRAVRRHT